MMSSPHKLAALSLSNISSISEMIFDYINSEVQLNHS